MYNMYIIYSENFDLGRRTQVKIRLRLFLLGPVKVLKRDDYLL